MIDDISQHPLTASTMPLSAADLLRCEWLAHHPAKRLVLSTRPSAKHPGYVDYGFFNLAAHQACTSKRPTKPWFVGVALDGDLRPYALTCADLSWREPSTGSRTQSDRKGAHT